MLAHQSGAGIRRVVELVKESLFVLIGDRSRQIHIERFVHLFQNGILHLIEETARGVLGEGDFGELAVVFRSGEGFKALGEFFLELLEQQRFRSQAAAEQGFLDLLVKAAGVVPWPSRMGVRCIEGQAR